MAIDDGLDWIWLQIRRSKDGQHVVFNSDRLDDRSSATGLIKDLTWEQLAAVDCGSQFAPRFAGAKMLSLEQALEKAKGRIGLVLECRDVDSESFAKQVAGAGLGDRVLIKADAELSHQLSEDSGGKLPLLAEWSREDRVPEWIEAHKPAATVSIAAADLTAETVREFQEAGIPVMAFSADESDTPDGWNALIKSGVDFVCTPLAEEFLVTAISASLPKRPVLYAAHRGAGRYAPENTPAAFDKAARLGANYVEIDVRTTKDGQFFLLHDANLDRTTNGRGPIRKTLSDDVRRLDAGGWFSPAFAATPPPTLDAALDKFPPDMGLYFDAKDIPPEDLAAALKAHHFVERTVVYQGPAYLKKLKEVDPRIRLLSPAFTQGNVDVLARTLRPYAVDARWSVLSREFIEHCHELGIKVFSDAPGSLDVAGYRQAIEWGIDLIQTDHPLRLWLAMEQVAAAPPAGR